MLIAAKEKALMIDLKNTNLDNPKSQAESDSLIFVINHDKIGSSQIRKLLRDNQEIINYLFGKEIKVIVTERRNPNTASLLFAKSGFAKEIGESHTQECGSTHGWILRELWL